MPRKPSSSQIERVPATISFTVAGIAEPKGSARAFTPKGWNRPIITSANPKLKDWQYAVQRAAGLECDRILHGPISIGVAFSLPRPKSVKDRYHQKKPDLDKLIRAINDALTGTAYRDDSEIIAIHATKQYCEAEDVPGAHITIRGYR